MRCRYVRFRACEFVPAWMIESNWNADIAGVAVRLEEPITPTPVPGNAEELNQESRKIEAGEFAFKSPSTPNPLICVGTEHVDCALDSEITEKIVTNTNDGTSLKNDNACFNDSWFIMATLLVRYLK